MNKSILLLTAVFLISLASATLLTDLQSDNILNISLNLTENTSEANIYFNTAGLPSDTQTIVYGDIEIEGFSISEFLKGIDFKAEIKDGELYPSFTYVNISTPYTIMILDNLLNALDYSFDSAEINDNPNLLIDLVKINYNNKQKAYGNWAIEKIGNNWKATGDKGADYFNLYNFNQLFSNSLSFMNNTFAVKTDLTDLELTNGMHEIQAEVTLNGEKVTKRVYLTIEGLTNETYIANNDILTKIEGLAYGTNITYLEENLTDYNAPSQVTGLSVMNISASINTSGEIYFKVNKSQVTDKNKVSLYVLEGSWTKLTTTYLLDNGLEYEYKATTPHFSIFMIGEEIPIATTTSSGGSSGGSSHHSSSSSSAQEIPIIPDIELEPYKPIKNETKEIELKQPEGNKFSIAELYPLLLIMGCSVIVIIILLVRRKEKNANNEKL
jgi:PGF-pre-PGF domain-containing protein